MIALSPETERLVLDRAKQARQSPDELIQAALRAYRMPEARRGRMNQAAVAAILAAFDAMPRTSDRRSTREILDEAWDR